MNENPLSDLPEPESTNPIGIFDSGIGGLSVLQHIQTQLPHESLLYFADSGHAPYGEKPEEFVVQRSLYIADFLLQRGAKALVVACNTATAVAIELLRQRYPTIPVVGIEPGLKPAAQQSRTKIVGVLATENTLASAKFARLQRQIAEEYNVQFLLQPCVGLAAHIEQGELHSALTLRLVQQYVAPLVKQQADMLVLGCTHYPFVQGAIVQVAQQFSAHVNLIDTGAAVARHLARLLQQQGLAAAGAQPATLAAITTGSVLTLQHSFARLLQQTPAIQGFG